jgi:hypothetical protein
VTVDFDPSLSGYFHCPSMKEPSQKLVSARKGKLSKEKPKTDVDQASPSSFEKALTLFPLDKRAKEATERDWKAYIANRLTAEEKFPGAKTTKSKSTSHEGGGGDGDEDDDDDDDEHATDEDNEYDPRGGELDFVYALNLIRRTMASLEKEMELGKGVLLRSFRVLDCDPLFRSEKRVIYFILPAYFSC